MKNLNISSANCGKSTHYQGEDAAKWFGTSEPLWILHRTWSFTDYILNLNAKVLLDVNAGSTINVNFEMLL